LKKSRYTGGIEFLDAALRLAAPRERFCALTFSRRIMNRWVFWPVTLVVGSLAAVSTAAVIERDWKTPGDGLLTYDDVNQREWLDLSVTNLLQFDGSNAEERYGSVISETMTGGSFAGFTVADAPRVIALALSAGIDVGTVDFETNEAPITNLTALLSVTHFTEPGRFSSMGFIDEVDTLELSQRAWAQSSISVHLVALLDFS
jgi:hypothetical protein